VALGLWIINWTSKANPPFTKKPMAKCTGKDILMSFVYHLALKISWDEIVCQYQSATRTDAYS